MRLLVMTCAMAVAFSGCPDNATPAVTSDAISDVGTDAAADADAQIAETTDVTDTGPVRPDLAWAVTERGPYQAGHRTLSVSYTPTGFDPPQTRTFELHLYYPTADTDGVRPMYLGLITSEHAWEDAALAAPVVAGSYPLHLFSHGHQGYAGSTERSLSFLASHGWVIAAPDHTGNLLTDGPNRDNPIYFLRGQDMSATLDHLASLPDGDSLAGLLDTGNTVLSGHSFGGYTAFTVAGAEYDLDKLASDCAQDDGPGGDPCTAAEIAAFTAGAEDARVKGIVPMAAGDRDKFGDTGMAAIDVPVLMLTGDNDQAATPAKSADVWAALPSGSIWVEIAGGCHQTFAIGGCPNISDDAGYAIVDAYLLAMSRAVVLGDVAVASVLDGTVVIAAEVTLQTK